MKLHFRRLQEHHRRSWRIISSIEQREDLQWDLEATRLRMIFSSHISLSFPMRSHNNVGSPLGFDIYSSDRYATISISIDFLFHFVFSFNFFINFLFDCSLTFFSFLKEEILWVQGKFVFINLKIIYLQLYTLSK